MNDTFLIIAGSLGIVVAIVHGLITQRSVVQPLLKLAGDNAALRPPLVRLFPILMQYSTLCWFAGGIALIAAPFWFDQTGRLVAAGIAGAFYASGALGNAWATRGRHPGWMLLAIALIFIALGA